jgi:hypothetical protein
VLVSALVLSNLSANIPKVNPADKARKNKQAAEWRDETMIILRAKAGGLVRTILLFI